MSWEVEQCTHVEPPSSGAGSSRELSCSPARSSAPVAIAAGSSQSSPAVHTQVQKDGTIIIALTAVSRYRPVGRLAHLASDTKTLIETAITRFIKEVPHWRR